MLPAAVAMARRSASARRRRAICSRRSAAVAACAALSARSASAAAASFVSCGATNPLAAASTRGSVGSASSSACREAWPCAAVGAPPAFLLPSAAVDPRRAFHSSPAATFGPLRMSTAAAVAEETVASPAGAATAAEGRPVASGPVLRFSPGRGGLGGVAAVRLREGDAAAAAAPVSKEGSTSSETGTFGKPAGFKAKGAEKQDRKGDDFVGRSVTFPDGRTGVVVAERPPIAFVLCDFDRLDEDGGIEDAGKDGESTCGEASVLDSMATIDVSDALLGKVLDWRGRELTVDAEDGSAALASEEGIPAANGDALRPRAIFAPIPKISDIALIDEPLLTGSAVVDALAPLGKGQNMLLVGRDGTGKSGLAMGAVVSQIRAARSRALKEGKKGVRCVVALTSSDGTERAEALRRLEEAGVRDDVVVVSARGGPPGEGGDRDDEELRSAESVAVAASACAIGEAFALSGGHDSLVVVDDIDRHKALWDWTTRVLVDMYGVDAVVNDDLEGGASSEMRGYYSALIQRAGRYNAYNGGGSVTLMMLASVPGGKDGSDDENRVFAPEDFDGASQKVKDRISILIAKSIPLTPANLRKIQIPVPSACDSENARRLALQHVDDLISMTDGQIWLDADLLEAGRRPPVNPQRSITRVGIGADTASRADAPAVRGLTGGLRFELAQAVDSIEGGVATRADEKQMVRRDAWLLAMHQEGDSSVRRLSENVVALLAAKTGHLDDAVRGGARAGTEEGNAAVEGMIDFARTAVPDVMDEIDETDDLSEEGREALEGAIHSYFESSS